MLGAQVGDALDVALRRRVHAAGAHHRLAEEGGHALGPDAQDLRLERGQRVVRHGRRVRHERAPVGHVGLDAADRRAVPVRAVVAVRAAEEVHALGLAAERPSAGARAWRPCRPRRRRRRRRTRARPPSARARRAARRARWPGGCRCRRTSSTPRAGRAGRRSPRGPLGARSPGWSTRGSRSRRGSAAPPRRRRRPPRRARSRARCARRPPCRRTGAESGWSRCWAGARRRPSPNPNGRFPAARQSGPSSCLQWTTPRLAWPIPARHPVWDGRGGRRDPGPAAAGR